MSKFEYLFLLLIMVIAGVDQTIFAQQLTPHFYDHVCPAALPTIKLLVHKAISKQPRMGASLLRLHFHDCFVNGCDGSVLLDDTPNFIGEKTAPPNLNSLRGFNVIDDIKSTLNSVCKGNVVSCADIVAVAARDSVHILGGGFYQVLLGRHDAVKTKLSDVNIPSPFSNLTALLSNFQTHGLDLKDLVVLSGAHTIGLARCTVYQSRIANDTNIDQQFRSFLQKSCPNPAAQNNNTNPLDCTPTKFDTGYYRNLIKQEGLLHSDQELYKNDGSQSDKLVAYYSKNPSEFRKDFGKSMIKMGNLKPLTGQNGQIRLNCRKKN